MNLERDRAQHVDDRVPLLSSLLALMLFVMSMCMFVVMIQQVGLLQVSRMLIFLRKQGAGGDRGVLWRGRLCGNSSRRD